MLTASIHFSLENRPKPSARAAICPGMGSDLADRFVGMYVNHWTLDYGERGRNRSAGFSDTAIQPDCSRHLRT